jgi:YD repeat-containing protein
VDGHYEYNDAGQVTTVRTDSGAGVVDHQFYNYDISGRLVRVIAPQEGGDRVVETYDHDAAGRKKKTLYIDVAAQRPNTHYVWGV